MGWIMYGSNAFGDVDVDRKLFEPQLTKCDGCNEILAWGGLQIVANRWICNKCYSVN